MSDKTYEEHLKDYGKAISDLCKSVLGEDHYYTPTDRGVMIHKKGRQSFENGDGI